MTGRADRRRYAWGALSVAAHVALLAAVLSVAPTPTRFVAPEVTPLEIAPRLVVPPKPPEPPAPEPKPEPPRPAPVKPPPTIRARKPLPAPPEVRPLAAVPAKADQPGDTVSDAEVASAARAGSGSGGGGGECDMARLLQEKLRADGRVRAALAAVPPGRAIRLWNGDWVRHGEEEGAGLSALREAIQWEVAWAPEACRKQPVRGLVLLSVADARVVVGAGAWRWSDLLFSRSTRPRAAG